MTDFETRGEERRQRWEDRWERRKERQQRRWRGEGGIDDGKGRIWTGVFLLIVGGAALLKSFLVPLPVWLFTWQTLLIAIGIFLGLRHSFHGGAWFILIIVGGAFLANDYFLNGELHKHVWPIVIIVMGVFFILRPSRKSMRNEWEQKMKSGEWSDKAQEESTYDKQDFIDTTSIFGSTKKNILSKNFVGGDITNIFGGTELNLTQADIQSKAVIDITTIFGGAELFVPSHWTVKSEIVTIFGGVEDKRSVSTIPDTAEKVLILKGTVIFGGVDIKNFKK